MLFALQLLFIVSICLSSIRGNDVTEKSSEIINGHLASSGNRPLVQRNQTKITRDDHQLYSLLATRRRQIIQNRFKNHIKNIVDISSKPNVSSTTLPSSLLIPKVNFPNNTRIVNVHYNLSDLLKNGVDNSTSEEQLNYSDNPSTESNVVNTGNTSERNGNKTNRKNVVGHSDSPQIPENKSKSSNNMPVIRNILYRRKMSFLNRKLPLDFDQISYDTLGLSEINKNHEDLILDNEDSLQVEESSHDKLIYYDVKNNASKKSGNNFEDSSEEIKSMSMHNKTFHNKKIVTPSIENITITTLKPDLSTKNITIKDDIILVLNNTELLKNETIKIKNNTINVETKVKEEISKQNKTEIKISNKNNTRFMSPSLYNYFRPLDVPEEEMQPFLHFGEKLPTTKHNISQPRTTAASIIEKQKSLPDNSNVTTTKEEKEIDENMDVSVVKPVYENKILKINLPNQKVPVARDYFKNRMQNKNNSTIPKVEKKNHINSVASIRNITRNRGFRNMTIFFQNKRNGLRQTINLRGNNSLANLKPITTTETSLSLNQNETISSIPINETLTIEAKNDEELSSTEQIRQITEQVTNKTVIVTPENLTTKLVQSTTVKVPTTSRTTSHSTTQQMRAIKPTEKSAITTEDILNVEETSSFIKIENRTDKPRTQLTESTRLPIVQTQTSKSVVTPAPKQQSTTATMPTTRILSTAVVTSVSIESKSKTKMNKTEEQKDPIKLDSVQTSTDFNDPEATVVATLSNYTSQTFYNNTKISPINKKLNIEHQIINQNSSLIHQRYNVGNRTKFILRPNRTTVHQTALTSTTEQSSVTDFIINVPDTESTPNSYQTEIPTTEYIKNVKLITSTTPKVDLTTLLIKSTSTRVKIGPRIAINIPEIKITTTTTSTTKLPVSTTKLTTSTTRLPTFTTKLPVSTTNKPETILSTASTNVEEKTTISSVKLFNSTVLTKQESESELPLATLFSVTDFKKIESAQNFTKISSKVPGTETVILRKESDMSFENIHAAYILAALGFLPMMVIVIYVIRSVMKKKHKNIEDFEAEMHHDSEKKSIINPVARLPALVLDSSNRWEFPRSKLRLQTLLGQGNFGQVWKAEADDLKGHVGLTRLVAVKTIKDGAGNKERDDLLKELAIMQKMGSHPNVVTLLGCCTEKEPYLLIMEYVMYGKLLTYLRDHRTRRDYYNFSDDAATLTARDLTVFAYCVARGMEYLASKGLIHRDMAARNVLVDHNKLCKIADFGMSRDASTTGGEVTEPRQPRNALPVRWMAIESLLYSVFTHQTDVWSFGVLLWEIVTLGSSPYANMSGREVMRLVCDGYRLERPNHCRPELYRLMARAWLADPSQRPTFAELRQELATMLDNTPAEGSYVDLESFRADSTVYEIDNCTPRGNYFTVKSRFSEFECDI